VGGPNFDENWIAWADGVRPPSGKEVFSLVTRTAEFPVLLRGQEEFAPVFGGVIVMMTAPLRMVEGFHGKLEEARAWTRTVLVNRVEWWCRSCGRRRPSSIVLQTKEWPALAADHSG
jgi:hypothetical protein